MLATSPQQQQQQQRQRQCSTREYSSTLLGPTVTINKAERLNACVRRAGGQVLRRAGGKQPVSMATSPAFHSAAAGCETEERGGRRALCVCLLGFGWKDLKRSLLRGAGIRQKAEKVFQRGI
ncbi:hypothetical protein ABVT39_010791 [Epinephelus coioides]